MLPVSIPPPKSLSVNVRNKIGHVNETAQQNSETSKTNAYLSSSLEPVVMWTMSALFLWYSVAVVKPIGTIFIASAYKKHTNIGLSEQQSK